MMLFRALIARAGFARPPLQADALDVAVLLNDLESHLLLAKDRAGLLLAARLHRKLEQIASDAPAGYVDVGAFSATPKPDPGL